MNFGAPGWLWALLAVPVLAVLFIRAEQRSAAKLREFVSARLLPQLGATVNPFRRRLRFALVLLAVALSIVSIAQPRWGYSYEEVKRKGLDLIIAVDTSRSMLANDVAPNRLQRVKLAAQDLFNELRGDRIGLIAFAGRSFLQAPLTIDYDAAVESLNDLDTSIIPEGGSNIADAISLAVRTFGQSAIGNRAMIIFTDGEELSGDAVKAAKSAEDAGVKIFTVGVGTPEGSLIPLSGAGGTTAFVKDSSGQVVKSKLDEKRLREIAEATGGMYLHLAGPATMKQLYEKGLAQMQAGDIQDRISRQPIERYQWPLGAALLALAASLLISERKAPRRRSSVAAVYDRRTRDVAATNGGHRPPLQGAGSAAASVILFCTAAFAHAAAPGLDAYRNERYAEALQELQQTLEEHPNTRAADKIHFGAGAAAYKMKDYAKALQSFSQALLSPDRDLQSRSHYNLGNTLYQRGETQKANDTKLADWQNALQHYEQTLKIDPENKEAKENAAFVQNKIDELKQQQEQQPTPTPSPSPNQQAKKDQNKSDQQQQQQQQQQQDQNKDQQDQSGSGDKQKPEDGKDQSEQQQDQKPGEENQPGQTPSPTPGTDAGASPSPSPGSAGASPTPGDETDASPSPGEQDAAPSPSPGEGDAEGEGSDSNQPNATPSATPEKKLSGDVKGASEDQTGEQGEAGAEAQVMNEAQMTPQQAERLLRAMRDEEQRVQLDERKASRRVYNDW